jgi:hypothetical protein
MTEKMHGVHSEIIPVGGGGVLDQENAQYLLRNNFYGL